MGFAVEEREIVLNSEYNKEKWEFIAKGQSGGVWGVVSGWKVLRGNIKARGIHARSTQLYSC